jgi:hypothetical protein
MFFGPPDPTFFDYVDPIVKVAGAPEPMGPGNGAGAPSTVRTFHAGGWGHDSPVGRWAAQLAVSRELGPKEALAIGR